MDDLVEWQKRDFPFGGFETVGPDKTRRIYINPGLIWQPGERDYQDTSWAEALCGVGFASGDRIINTFNYHMWPLAFMLDDSAKMIGATVIPTGVGNTLMQVKIMNMLKINGFMGTPSFLMTLAQRAESMGLELKKDITLQTALVGAEMLPESLRSRIENHLEMTVRQGYGTVFLGCIGYECPHMTGLHVPDNILVEVVDPNTGRHVKDGAAGEIVATNFNMAYPMIRLATGDLSVLAKGSCPCGRTGPILKKILGRIDQAVKVRGTFVHPWQADEVISRYNEVFKYQVVITRENFGCGSSREHAPRIIKICGVSAVLAKSFARIFFRNSINIGLLLVECDTEKISEGDEIEVDIEKGIVINISRKIEIPFIPPPTFMREISESGGLVEYVKKKKTLG